MIEVHPTGSLNENAMPLQWIQCPTRWMQYVVMEDAVPTKMDAVSHNLESLLCVVV